MRYFPMISNNASTIFLEAVKGLPSHAYLFAFEMVFHGLYFEIWDPDEPYTFWWVLIWKNVAIIWADTAGLGK